MALVHIVPSDSLEGRASDTVSSLDAETLDMLPLTSLSFRDVPPPTCVTQQTSPVTVYLDEAADAFMVSLTRIR